MTNLIPPFVDAWDLPEFHQPNAYWSGQPIGALYASLAPQTPPVWSNEYSTLAEGKVSEAFLRAVEYYKARGETGLREFIQRELDAAEAYVARSMARNVFLRQGT
jgi:arabinosaccharide transport system substrate-binding protein